MRAYAASRRAARAQDHAAQVWQWLQCLLPARRQGSRLDVVLREALPAFVTRFTARDPTAGLGTLSSLDHVHFLAVWDVLDKGEPGHAQAAATLYQALLLLHASTSRSFRRVRDEYVPRATTLAGQLKAMWRPLSAFLATWAAVAQPQQPEGTVAPLASLVAAGAWQAMLRERHGRLVVAAPPAARRAADAGDDAASDTSSVPWPQPREADIRQLAQDWHDMLLQLPLRMLLVHQSHMQAPQARAAADSIGCAAGTVLGTWAAKGACTGDAEPAGPSPQFAHIAAAVVRHVLLQALLDAVDAPLEDAQRRPVLLCVLAVHACVAAARQAIRVLAARDRHWADGAAVPRQARLELRLHESQLLRLPKRIWRALSERNGLAARLGLQILRAPRRVSPVVRHIAPRDASDVAPHATGSGMMMVWQSLALEAGGGTEGVADGAATDDAAMSGRALDFTLLPDTPGVWERADADAPAFFSPMFWTQYVAACFVPHAMQCVAMHLQQVDRGAGAERQRLQALVEQKEEQITRLQRQLGLHGVAPLVRGLAAPGDSAAALPRDMQRLPQPCGLSMEGAAGCGEPWLQELAAAFVCPLTHDLVQQCPVLLRRADGGLSSHVYEYDAVQEWLRYEARARGAGAGIALRESGQPLRDPATRHPLDLAHPRGVCVQPHPLFLVYRAMVRALLAQAPRVPGHVASPPHSPTAPGSKRGQPGARTEDAAPRKRQRADPDP